MANKNTKKSSELTAEEKALKEAEALKEASEAKLKALKEAEEKAAKEAEETRLQALKEAEELAKKEAEEIKKQAEAEAQANLLKVKNWTCTTQCFFNGRLYHEGDVLSDASAADLGGALAYFKEAQ